MTEWLKFLLNVTGSGFYLAPTVTDCCSPYSTLSEEGYYHVTVSHSLTIIQELTLTLSNQLGGTLYGVTQLT